MDEGTGLTYFVGERKLRRLAQNRVSAGKARVKKKSEILEIQR